MKQLLKNILVPIMSNTPVSILAERLVTPGVPIFMMHRFKSETSNVSGHDPIFLRQCLSYLKKKGYHFLSLQQLLEYMTNAEAVPKKSVVFTIDDGFFDHATIAAPIFIEYECPLTIFLISGLLDGELWPWDDKIAYLINHTKKSGIEFEIDDIFHSIKLDSRTKKRQAIGHIQNLVKQLPASNIEPVLSAISNTCELELPQQAPDSYRPMSWDQARQLESEGIQFGPHTRTHRILSRLDDSDSLHEITHSYYRLKQELTSPSRVFCYPTGRSCDFTKREINHIREAGLIGAVATEPTYVNLNIPDSDYLYRLPRFGFPNNLHDFIQYSSWIERAK